VSLSIEIRVNGHPVVTVVGHNTNGRPVSSYEGQYSVFGMDGTPVCGEWFVENHKRASGLTKLSETILKEVNKDIRMKELE
jgi:hypothetical protein